MKINQNSEKVSFLRCKILVSHKKGQTGLKLVKVISILTNTEPYIMSHRTYPTNSGSNKCCRAV